MTVLPTELQFGDVFLKLNIPNANDLDPLIIIRFDLAEISQWVTRDSFYNAWDTFREAYSSRIVNTYLVSIKDRKCGTFISFSEHTGTLFTLYNGVLHNPYGAAIWRAHSSYYNATLETWILGRSVSKSQFLAYNKEYVKLKTVEEQEEFNGYWLACHEAVKGPTGLPTWLSLT